jgi:hypothetical protein
MEMSNTHMASVNFMNNELKYVLNALTVYRPFAVITLQFHFVFIEFLQNC